MRRVPQVHLFAFGFDAEKDLVYMKKRILSLLLVAVILFTTLAFELPIGVNAAQATRQFYNTTTGAQGYNASISKSTEGVVVSASAADHGVVLTPPSVGFTPTHIAVVFKAYYGDNNTVQSAQFYCITSSGVYYQSTPISYRANGNYVRVVYELSNLTLTPGMATSNSQYWPGGTPSLVRFDVAGVKLTSIVYSIHLADSAKAVHQSTHDNGSIYCMPATYRMDFENGGVSTSLPKFTTNNSSSAIWDTQTVQGVTAQWSGTPSNSNYNFTGWKLYKYNNSGNNEDNLSNYNVIGSLDSDDYSYKMTGDTSNAEGQYIHIKAIAQWEPKNYTITWANTNGNGSSTTTNVAYGSTPSAPVTPSKAADDYRTYTFTGWSPAIATCTGNATYTAQFTQNYKTFYVTYDLDGGSGVSATGSYTGQNAFTLPTPTKSGYKFAGWEVTSNGGNWESRVYSGGETIGAMTKYGNITLKAKWEIDSYTINWYSHDGTQYYGSTSVKPGVIPQPGSFDTSRAPSDGYDYTFVGWNTSPNAESDNRTGAAGNVTYYAAYTKSPTNYTISYDLAGGGLETENPTGYNIQSATFTLNNPTKEGYTFLGWTGSNGSTPQTSVSVLTGTAGNLSYTANWAPINYTISFENIDGTNLDGHTISYNIESGDIQLPAPTKAGYRFDGWTGEEITTPIATVTVPTGSMGNKVYTATWTALDYSINYHKNDGSGNGEQYSVKYTTDCGNALDTPERNGYTFLGWIVNGNVPTNTVGWEKGVHYTTVPNNAYGYINLIADWSPINYTISLEGIDGSTITEGTLNYTVENDDFSLPSPTKNAYTFIGWTGEGITEPSKDVTIAKGTTGNKTYTANWAATEYTIHYDLNNAAASPNEQYEANYTVEDSGKSLDTPEKTGYTFAGWTVYGVTDETVGWVMNEKYFAIPDGAYGNVNLIASWSPVDYTVTWIDGNGEVIKTAEKVEYDNIPSADGLTPTKESTNTHDYVWTGGWDAEISHTPPSIVYTAQFTETPRIFTITYVYGDQSQTQSYTYGENIQLSEFIPEKSGYSFKNWNVTSTDGNWEAGTFNPSDSIEAGKYGNVTLSALWNTVDYSIAFNTNGGEAIDPITYTVESEDITLPTPTKTGHTFIGWTGEGIDEPTTNVTVSTGSTGDKVYTANWTVNTYTVTWVDEDGATVLKSEVLEYGATPEYGTDPEKAEDNLNTYTFAGWTPDITTVTGEATYKATYTSIPKTYTIIYTDGDSTIGTQNFTTDTNVTLTKPDYTKDHYTFDGWKVTSAEGSWTVDEIFDPENLTIASGTYGNVTLSAQWAAIEYTITYKNGETTVSTQPYTIETVLTLADAPENNDFDFAGWKVTEITADGSWTINDVFTEALVGAGNYGDITLSAQWSITVIWKNYDGTILETDVNVQANTKPSYDGATPAKPSTQEYRYKFNGWSPAVEEVTKNTVYIATFEESAAVYTIVWQNYDGTVLETDENVPYGTKPSYDGATPERATTEDYYYNFNGWDPSPETTITGDMVYVAKFIERPKYVITYVLSDGTVENDGQYTVKYAPADSITLPVLSMIDHNFVGWTVSSASDPWEDPWSKIPNGFISADVLGFTPEQQMYGNVTLTAVFELAITDLVIEANGTEKIDENQSYIFDITDGNGYSLTVCIMADTIKGGENPSVTVKDVPMGTYTVTEQDGWSWRYANDKNNDCETIVLTAYTDDPNDTEPNPNTVTFTMTRASKEKQDKTALWLGGDSYKRKFYNTDDNGENEVD